MAERMVKLQSSVIVAMQDAQLKKDMRTNNVPKPTDDHWATASTVVKILRPFAAQVTKWSDQRYVTYSATSPAIFGLLACLTPDPADNLVAEQLKDKLSREIKMRFGLRGYEAKDGATYPRYLSFVAALVDPRFKELPFLSDEEKESVADFAQEIFESLDSPAPAQDSSCCR